MLDCRPVEEGAFADDLSEGRASSCAESGNNSPTHGEGTTGGG